MKSEVSAAEAKQGCGKRRHIAVRPFIRGFRKACAIRCLPSQGWQLGGMEFENGEH